MVLISSQMEGSELGGEHSGEVAVVTSVASPSPASASPASASASAATIITNSTNITISNIRGGDIAAATEGGADGEVLKGANGAEMMTAFSEVGAGRTARTEKKAVGDTSTTDVSAEELIGGGFAFAVIFFFAVVAFFLFPGWYFLFFWTGSFIFSFSLLIFCTFRKTLYVML